MTRQRDPGSRREDPDAVREGRDGARAARARHEHPRGPEGQLRAARRRGARLRGRVRHRDRRRGRGRGQHHRRLRRADRTEGLRGKLRSAHAATRDERRRSVRFGCRRASGAALLVQLGISRLLSPLWIPLTSAIMRFGFGWRVDAAERAVARASYRRLRSESEAPILDLREPPDDGRLVRDRPGPRLRP